MTKSSYPNKLLHVNFGGFHLLSSHLNDIYVSIMIKHNDGTLNESPNILQKVVHHSMNTWTAWQKQCFAANSTSYRHDFSHNFLIKQ